MKRTSSGLYAALACIGFAVLAGCAGTSNAYKAAAEREGIERLAAVAYVIGEHYTATLTEINELRNAGQLSTRQVATFQRLAQDTAPSIRAMLDTAESAQAVGSADSAEALNAAISAAAVDLAELIEAVKAINDRAGIRDATGPPLTRFA